MPGDEQWSTDYRRICSSPIGWWGGGGNGESGEDDKDGEFKTLVKVVKMVKMVWGESAAQWLDGEVTIRHGGGVKSEDGESCESGEYDKDDEDGEDGEGSQGLLSGVLYSPRNDRISR